MIGIVLALIATVDVRSNSLSSLATSEEIVTCASGCSSRRISRARRSCSGLA